MKCPACLQPIDPAVVAAGLGLHPTCEPLDVHPDVVVTELLSIIADSINGQPRSMQTRIGPSEMGVPCDRRIGYKMAGTPETNNQGGVPWKPAVGTAVHLMIADFIAAHEIARFDTEDVTPRWHVEERVNVGNINGVEIAGSCDLFDAHTGLVVDWKTTSWNQIREKYRPHGPGEQYEVQAMLYGLGWENAGFPVRNVMLVFLVRDGSFDQRYVWSAPYDPARAKAALERVRNISNAITGLGANLAIPLLDTAPAYCRFCPYFQQNGSNDSRSCAGNFTDKQEQPTLTQLIGA